jgi:hypothetical protein
VGAHLFFQPLEILVQLPASLQGLFADYFVQLTKTLLQVRRFNEKQPEYRVATVGAVPLASNAVRIFDLHLAKGLICVIHKKLIASEQLIQVHFLR